MNTQKRNGNAILACLVAAAVAVALAIVFLPDGEAKNSTAEVAEAADAASDNDEEDVIAATTLVKVGAEAPDFTVEMLDGSLVTLSELRGDVVLVNFWATWCPPCREELKRVQSDIIDRFAGKPFRMIAISRGEKRGTVEKFIADNGYRFPVAVDPAEEVFLEFATNYIPRNFLIDAEGRVAFVGVGYDEEEFASLVDKIDETLKNL